MAEDHECGRGICFNVCFEMVHFGAKVTNAVHHNWFWGIVTVKKLTLD